MTTTVPPASTGPSAADDDDHEIDLSGATVGEVATEDAASGAPARRLAGAARWGVGLGLAVVIFGGFMLMKGVNPISAYGSMVRSTFSNSDAFGGIFVRATPIMLAALAVSVPARAGLINVGGEGQLIIGAVAATGVSIGVGGSLPGAVTLLLMAVAAMAAGAAWSGIAAVLRLGSGINEAVTTLLLNYVAVDVMLFLIYDKWKDKNGSGQPASAPLPISQRLSLLGTSRVHIGIIVALVAAVVCWLVLRRTSWGFRLSVVGGNPEAARRSGLRVNALVLSAMLVGGALAGLGGLTQLAGAEFKLRPGFVATYGYLGFLASWLGRHRPLHVAGAALVLSAIAIGGDSLQIDSALPGATVNILIALVLLAAFAVQRGTKETS
ncbi:MAG: inner-rane translocator [Acidimicrobiales bacterium]|nr:inner-rane translocator [Acidimicrobiales bacterium]